MKPSRAWILTGLFLVSLSNAAVPEPGGTPEAMLMALSNPDEYAWRLFFFMNRQAQLGVAGVADESKPFGTVDPGASLVWETWALASGGKASEVYKPDGGEPQKWDQLKRGARVLVLDRNLERDSVLKTTRGIKPQFFPTTPLAQEVRQNRAHFEFVVAKGMYNREGLEALRDLAIKQQNRQLIQFPQSAKEIKAQWLTIAEADKTRYLWREVKDGNGKTTLYGLVSLHVITKDLSNWFWADFGHVDCESKLRACNIPDQEEAKTDPVDSTTRGSNAPSGSNGVRKETVGTVWQNYILRGTQIDSTTPFGKPTVLSNPVIENGFQHSSCLSCHARAAVGPRKRKPDGTPSPDLNILSPGDPTLGAVNPGLFGAAEGQIDEITYLQTDFIWSAPFRAQRKR